MASSSLSFRLYVIFQARFSRKKGKKRRKERKRKEGREEGRERRKENNLVILLTTSSTLARAGKGQAVG